jgi:hypothetical protein
MTDNLKCNCRNKNKERRTDIGEPFSGITMAKASITPTSVSYYEKIKGTYFEVILAL